MSQQHLYKKIFGSLPASENEAKLNEIISKYPYYSTAHYFLLQHASKELNDYAHIAGRTALHFNNAYYLNYLLNADVSEAVTLQELKQTIEEEVIQPEVHDINHRKDDPLKDQSKEDELVFEPLHTTDYFASQGIKLSDEVKPDDKLGKQLRSFTDWLKTMKKVHEQRLPAGNAALDMTVQTIAEKSNQEEVIITESMADVYREQGKTSKAREIYQKLSLLDPSKSAYFAAKIDTLKDS